MGQNRGRTKASYGCLVVILVATFVLFVLLPPLRTYRRSRAPAPDESMLFLWVAFAAPWITWLWWNNTRSSSGGAEDDDDSVARRALRFRVGIWLVTAALMLAGVVVIRFLSTTAGEGRPPAASSASHETKAKRSRVEEIGILGETLQAEESVLRSLQGSGPLTPTEQRKGMQAREEAHQRIAAEHQMTVAELNDLMAANVPGCRPLTFYQCHGFVIGVLGLDGLLILNMPLYWLLALVLFGGWGDFRIALGEIVRPEERLFQVRLNLFFLLCGLAIAGEAAMLHICLS